MLVTEYGLLIAEISELFSDVGDGRSDVDRAPVETVTSDPVESVRDDSNVVLPTEEVGLY